MRVAMLSGNLGNYDEPAPWVEQEAPGVKKQNIFYGPVTIDVFRFNDGNFPPRPKAMTSRLMAGMPKMFGWQIKPGYDIYIWVDASCAVSHPRTAWWFIDHLYGIPPADIALFRHPDRSTVLEEWKFVRDKLESGNAYLTSRYGGEWLDQQANAILADSEFQDNALYASTAFAYRNTERVHKALKEWWYHKTRYLIHDQLALPYVIQKAGLTVNVINEHYMKTPYLTFVRKSKRYVAS